MLDRLGGPSAPIYMHCTRFWNNTLFCLLVSMLTRWGVHLPAIYMHCARSQKKTDVVYWYARHLCSIYRGGSSACGIYMSISLYIYIDLPFHYI